MKNFFLKWHSWFSPLFLCLLFLFFFSLGGKSAQATEILDYEHWDDSYQDNYEPWVDSTGNAVRTYGDYVGATSTYELSKIVTRACVNTGGVARIYATAWSGAWVTQIGTSTPTEITTICSGAEPDYATTTFEFLTKPTFTGGQSYTLKFHWQSSSTASVTAARKQAGDGIILRTYSGEETPSMTISFDVPVAGAQPDFPNWLVAIEGEIEGVPATTTIRYGISSSSLNFLDRTWTDYTVDTYGQSIPKSRPLWYPPLTSPVTWYAQATFENGTSTATSTMLEFQVTSDTEFPTSTTLLASTTLQCGGSGWVADSFCSVLVFLFVPSQSSTEKFANFATNTGISDRVPFGYYVVIQDALDGIQQGTSSISLMDASTTAAFADVFDPVRTGISWILWILFMFWGYHRFTNFEF